MSGRSLPTTIALSEPDHLGDQFVLRIAAAVVLTAHGVIHLIGFVVPWRIATLEDFPYDTMALNGTISLGEDGARILGLLWLVFAVGFVVAGIGVARRSAWAVPLLVALAAGSLVACVLGLPEAAAGIAVDVAILGAIGLRAMLGSDRSSSGGRRQMAGH